MSVVSGTKCFYVLWTLHAHLCLWRENPPKNLLVSNKLRSLLLLNVPKFKM